jgi:hypothetical protein
MLSRQQKIIWLAGLGWLFLSFPGLAAIVTTKPSATSIIPSASTKSWYGSSISTLTPSLSTMTWYTSYINYHNPELLFTSSENVAADSSGNLYVCWVDPSSDELKLSTNESGEWAVEKIADDVYSCPHISVDSSGNTHLISYSSDTGYYRHITGVSHSWTITNLGEIEDAIYTSFAIDSSSKVHVSYFDSTDWILKYASNVSGTTLAAQTVDSTYRSGYNSEIALDASDKVHIVYYDATANTLNHATNESGIFVIEAIDGMASPSIESSIAVNASGQAFIAYATDGGIPKFVTNESGSWKKKTMETVLTSDDEFSNFSIALDSQGSVHVSYANTTLETIRYATNQNGAWQSFKVADCELDCNYFTKVIPITGSLSSALSLLSTSGVKFANSKVTSATVIVDSSAKYKTFTKRVDIIYQDRASAQYNLGCASTKEIADTCSDFTGTLTDADCDGTEDSEDPDYLDLDDDGLIGSVDTDDDGDGTPDESDAFPDDPSETTDTDSDGIGNNTDTDDDGDGLGDSNDANPTTADADGDGILDGSDPDYADNDGDGTPDAEDTDDDDDGISDSEDTDTHGGR